MQNHANVYFSSSFLRSHYISEFFSCTCAQCCCTLYSVLTLNKIEFFNIFMTETPESGAGAKKPVSLQHHFFRKNRDYFYMHENIGKPTRFVFSVKFCFGKHLLDLFSPHFNALHEVKKGSKIFSANAFFTYEALS